MSLAFGFLWFDSFVTTVMMVPDQIFKLEGQKNPQNTQHMRLWRKKINKNKTFLVLEISAFKTDHLHTVSAVNWQTRWKSRLRVNPDLKNLQDSYATAERERGSHVTKTERSGEVSDLIWKCVSRCMMFLTTAKDKKKLHVGSVNFISIRCFC